MPAKNKTPEEQQEEQIVDLIRSLPSDPALRAYRILRKLEIPLPNGAIKEIASQLNMPRWRVDQAAALRVAFESDPKARAEWEAKLLGGIVTVRRVLAHLRRTAELAKSK